MLAAWAAADGPPATIRHIRMVSGSQVEVSASAAITPQAQLLTNPDRLALDFPNAVAAPELRAPAVHGGQVRAIRVGLFTTNPPVTRVVLDLASPLPFQIIPIGRSVMVQLGGTQKKLTAFHTEFEVVDSPPPVAPPPPPQPVLNVQFSNGMLKIRAERVSLAQVLKEIQRQTGAEITIPTDAQDQVVVNLGPGPVRDVIAALLNGSQFNFVMIGSDSDQTQLRSVILTPKSAGSATPPSPVPATATTPGQPPNQ